MKKKIETLADLPKPEVITSGPIVVLKTSTKEEWYDQKLVAKFFSTYVAAAKIKPGVIVWGERFFVFNKIDERGHIIYVESIAFNLIEGTTCEKVD